MMAPDWAAYIFCSVVVSLTMVGEMKDIMLVSFAIENAHVEGQLSTAWKFFLSLLNKIRRWVFIPSLMLTVLGVVIYNSGEAGQVCFSTVALLFIVDIGTPHRVLHASRHF